MDLSFAHDQESVLAWALTVWSLNLRFIRMTRGMDARPSRIGPAALDLSLGEFVGRRLSETYSFPRNYFTINDSSPKART